MNAIAACAFLILIIAIVVFAETRFTPVFTDTNPLQLPWMHLGMLVVMLLSLGIMLMAFTPSPVS